MVGVRGKLVELDSPLVPVVSALSASVADHLLLLYEIELDCTMRLSGNVRLDGSHRNSAERSLITSR
jgi:hypothetical protein